MGQYVTDDTLPRFWNTWSRHCYNSTGRCMTPVWNDGQHILWLSGQKAANNTRTLKVCDIMTRMRALGTWGCPRFAGIKDLQPIRIADVLKSNNLDESGRALKQAIWHIDRALTKGSVFVFCKRGCRRGAVFAGCYRMAKTRVAPPNVFHHLQCLRSPVENGFLVTSVGALTVVGSLMMGWRRHKLFRGSRPFGARWQIDPKAGMMHLRLWAWGPQAHGNRLARQTPPRRMRPSLHFHQPRRPLHPQHLTLAMHTIPSPRLPGLVLSPQTQTMIPRAASLLPPWKPQWKPRLKRVSRSQVRLWATQMTTTWKGQKLIMQRIHQRFRVRR